MHRQGVITYGRHGINYDKNATDSRIKSYWIKKGETSASENDDIHQICGPLAGHVPALCDPTIAAAMPPGPGAADGVYVDCTFGRGGHSAALLARLSEQGRLFAFDVDPAAVKVGRMLEQRDSRFRIIHRPFGSLAEAIPKGIELSGVLMDLGVSSPQLDEKARGFTSGPLDMRMNPRVGQPASKLLTELDFQELAWVVREYGEDKDPLLAARIAQAITMWQQERGPFRDSQQLADAVARVKRGLDDRSQKPEKLTFQAIRMWINQEPVQFEMVLEGAFERLKYGGRCAVIVFKRSETQMLVRFVTAHEEPDPEFVEGWPREKIFELYPLLKSSQPWCVRQVGDPIAPTEQELLYNNRCRSARTFVLEKRRRKVRWSLPTGYSPSPIFKQPSRSPVFGGAHPCPRPPDAPPDLGPEEVFCQYMGRKPDAKLRWRSAGTLGRSGQDAEDCACGGGASSSAETTSAGRVDRSEPSMDTAFSTTSGELLAEDGDIAAWLLSLDDGAGKLLQYREKLEAKCASMREFWQVYGRSGTKDGFDIDRLCSDLEFKKVAHRRFVERWAAAELATLQATSGMTRSPENKV